MLEFGITIFTITDHISFKKKDGAPVFQRPERLYEDGIKPG